MATNAPSDEAAEQGASARADGPGPSTRARSQPQASAQARPTRRRAVRPPIDLDASIAAAKAAARAASKALAKARAENRAERKKKARLVRKAGQLSAQDLERIAVLKRTGWWDPSTSDAAAPAVNGDVSLASGASSNAGATSSGQSAPSVATGAANAGLGATGLQIAAASGQSRATRAAETGDESRSGLPPHRPQTGASMAQQEEPAVGAEDDDDMEEFEAGETSPTASPRT